MNKKRLVKGLTIVALLAIVAVGATLAYLSATTGTKTNRFQSDSKITGETTETKFDTDTIKNFTPGEVIAKNPSLSIKKGSEKAYGALSLDYYGDVEYNTDNSIKSQVQVSEADFARYATINGVPNTGWTKIATSAKGSTLYMYDSVLDPTNGDATPAKDLFDNITVNAGLTTITTSEATSRNLYTYEDTNANGKLDTEEEGSKKLVSTNSTTTTNTVYCDAEGNYVAEPKLPSFVIDVNGFAVQSENLDQSKAVTELIKLANVNRPADDQFTAI